jgi:hypothetical protein
MITTLPASAAEETYLAARDAAWAQYHAVMGDACTAHQRDEISASQLMAVKDAAYAALDDTLSAARKAAGYQS